MHIRKLTFSVAAAALVGAGVILAAPAAAQADSCPEGAYAAGDGSFIVYGCVDGARSVPLDGGGYWVAQPGAVVPVMSDAGQVGTATVTASSVEITSTAGPGVPVWATLPSGVIVCGAAPEPEPEPEPGPTVEPTAEPTSTPTGAPEPSTAPTADLSGAPAGEPTTGPRVEPTAESTSAATAGPDTVPALVSGASTPAPETGTPAPAPVTAETPAGLPATGSSGRGALAGVLAGLGAAAFALARTARRADDLAEDMAYRARRGIEPEAEEAVL